MNKIVDSSLSASLFLDLDGVKLTEQEKELLTDPLVSGVILFSRNTQNAEQVAELVASIRAVRPELIISLDQEGGRVQRLKEGVTVLPPVKALSRYHCPVDEKQMAARLLGYLMAVELRQLDIDISFAPVLDIDYARNTVIGDRAFGCDVETVTKLSASYIEGMQQAGMPSTIKHFPGHGWANADTHHADAVDERAYSVIDTLDLVPFKHAIKRGAEAVMFAHVLYPACDPSPAGFSDYWIGSVLRDKLGFSGLVFSDDLSMKAAHSAGGYADRAKRAIAAGCQILLCCNDRQGSLEVLKYMHDAEVTPLANISALKAKPFTLDAEILSKAQELAVELRELSND